MSLTYSPVTGEFYKGGERVGCMHNRGYVTLWYEGKQWLGHRLAFKLLGLPIPPQVDHANGVRTCNAWHNLREADNRTNQEARHTAVSSTGMIGVFLRKDTGKYTSKIKSHGVTRNLGCFNTPEEARAAYLKAKQELHTLHPNA